MPNVIDSREPHFFKKKLPDWEVRQLEVGDYIAGRFLVERKELDDLYSSIMDGRYSAQVKSMKEVKGLQPIFIIEGTNYNFSWRNKKRVFDTNRSPAFAGVFSSLLAKHNISVVPSPNKTFTVMILKGLASKSLETYEEVVVSRVRQGSFALNVLVGIEGVGIKKAEKLVEIMADVMGKKERDLTMLDIVMFINSYDIESVEGFGKKTVSKIYKRLGGDIYEEIAKNFLQDF